MHKKIGIIFDMDGVVADNVEYHKIAWQAFFKKRGLKLTNAYFANKMNGRTNREILQTIFKRDLTPGEIEQYTNEKEILYRKLYARKIKSVPGIINFLKELKKNKIKFALATAAPTPNVDFVMGGTKTKKYFKLIVDESQIKHGKPAPDIFLKAANKLKIKPKYCVVFEDAPLGLQAAEQAGMKRVGLATTYPTSKLKPLKPNLIIKNFTGLKLSKVKELI